MANQMIYGAAFVAPISGIPDDGAGILADKTVHGSIWTGIYANMMPWGDVVFKVTQKKLYSRPGKRGVAESYDAGDLWDVIRGAYWAHRWIRKRQRRPWRRIVALFPD